jgi:CRISPR-associated CXXC_CXXC protein Cst1
MEKIYLGDWLYNAGIVGFLRINNNLWDIKGEELISKDENLLKIGDNYIEIDREIFEGFTDRFFNYAFNLYGKYDETLKKFQTFLESLNEKTFESIKSEFKNIIEDYSLLKKKLGDIKADNLQNLKDTIKKAIEIMEINKEEFIEDSTKNLLETFYGQKSFLNNKIKESKKEKFRNEFEKPLKLNKNKKENLVCIICGERLSKKDTNFDTGFSVIFGLNKDAINFNWDFDPRLSSCDICEIIYFCYFAGLTKLNKKYYFVNTDNNISSLLIQNGSFGKELKKAGENPENLLTEFLIKQLLKAKKLQSSYILSNTNFIEIEIKKISKYNKRMVKVFNFNIDYSTANFIIIKGNQENLKSISSLYITLSDNETKTNATEEFLKSILQKNLSYKILYESFKSTIKNKTNNKYSLQKLITMYLLYKQKVGGKEMGLEEKSLDDMYIKGKILLERLKERDAENKIQSIAYKLLNALKIGDTNQFMDVMMRVHMAYDLEVPELLIEALKDKDNFYLLGYSFLNGLLEIQEENQ